MQASKKALTHRRPQDGITALMLACEDCNAEIVNMLLEAGAEPWKQDKHQLTCLHYAAAKGFAAAIKPLVEAATSRPRPSSFGDDGSG
jgi:ankyrin repeat protein